MAKIFCLHPIRYPPSSRQTSHEEGKEWLRSHSTGGLQDTGSPLSPPGTTSTNTGKYHYSNLRMLTYIISDLWFSVVEPTFLIIPWTNIIKCFFFNVILIFVLQWAPPVCHSIIFPAPAWAAPTVFQHRTRSSCTGRDTLWGAVPPHWRNGHMGLAGLAPSGTAQMKVSIAVTLLDKSSLIYLYLYIANFSFYAHVC